MYGKNAYQPNWITQYRREIPRVQHSAQTLINNRLYLAIHYDAKKLSCTIYAFARTLEHILPKITKRIFVQRAHSSIYSWRVQRGTLLLLRRHAMAAASNRIMNYDYTASHAACADTLVYRYIYTVYAQRFAQGAAAAVATALIRRNT